MSRINFDHDYCGSKHGTNLILRAVRSHSRADQAREAPPSELQPRTDEIVGVAHADADAAFEPLGAGGGAQHESEQGNAHIRLTCADRAWPLPCQLGK